MQTFEIVMNDKDDILAETEPSCYINTNFSVRIGDSFFPDKQWTDLAYPILCIWTESILRKHNHNRAKYCLPFMDGPYWMDVEKKGTRLCIKGRFKKRSRQTSFSFQCDQKQFFTILLRAFDRLEEIIALRAGADQLLQATVKNSMQHYRKLINQVNQGE